MTTKAKAIAKLSKPASKTPVKAVSKAPTKTTPKKLDPQNSPDVEGEAGVRETPESQNADKKLEKQLQVVFSDRLTQIIDKRNSVIRSGRGRVGDLSAMFKIHYTTAHRLITGQSLPSVPLLTKIADAFDVSESWLMGRGPIDDEALLVKGMFNFRIFTPRTGKLSDDAITMPVKASFVEFGESRCIYMLAPSVIHGKEEGIIVQVTAQPVDQDVHALYDPVLKTVSLRRVSIASNRKVPQYMTVSELTGEAENLIVSELDFGDPTRAKRMCIIGPVAAQLAQGYMLRR